MRFSFTRNLRQTTLLQRRVIVVGLALVALVVTFAFHPFKAHGNACTSNGTGGGNWNTAATWTGCGATTPQSGDSVTISAGDTVTLDVDSTITSLSFASGATAATLSDDGNGRKLTISGTVTMGQPTASVTNAWNINGGAATVSGLITFSGSTNDATRIAKIAITTGSLNADGGITFTASNSASAVIDMSGGAGTLHMKGALTTPANSSTFTFGTTSTFDYYDSSAQTLNFPSAGKYNNLTINNSAGVTYSALVGSGNVGGNITVQSGVLKNGGFSTSVANLKTFTVSNGAAFEFSGTSGGSIALGIGAAVSFGASSTERFLQTGATTVGAATYGNLEIKPGSTNTMTLAGGTTTVAGNLTIGDGTNTGVTTAATNSSTVTVTGNVTIAANSSFTANASNTLSVGGSWSNSGTFTNSSGTTKFTSTATGKTIAGTLTGSSAFYNLTFDGVGGAWSFSNDATAANNFTITHGTVTAPSGTLNVGAAWTNNGTFTHNSGTVNFNGTSVSVLIDGTLSGSSAFNNITVNGSGSLWILNANCDIAGNLNLTNGGFSTGAANATVNLSGNLTSTGSSWSLSLNASTFNVSGNWDTSSYIDDFNVIYYSTSTVVMNGSGTHTIKTGSDAPWVARFYNLSVGTASGKTTQLLEVTAFTNQLILGAGTFDLNSKGIYSAGATNPLSLNASGTFGTGNGDLIFYGSSDANIPAFTYHSNIVVQQDTGKNVVQQGDVTLTGQLYMGCCSRGSGWNTANHNLTVGSQIYFEASVSSFTAGSSTVSIGTNLNNAAGATISAGTSTFVFNGGGGGTINTGGQSLYNVTIAGTGSWTVGAALTATNDLTMTSGNIIGTNNVTVNGNVAGTAGQISLTGGTFEQRVAASKNFGATSGSTTWTFFDLTFSNSNGTATPITVTTQTGGTGTVIITDKFLIGKTGDAAGATTTLNAGNRTWSMTQANGTETNPFRILASPQGVLTGATSTISYGGNPTGNTTVQSSSGYYNLTLANVAETYVLGGDVTIANALSQSGNGVAGSGAALNTTASNYNITAGNISLSSFGASITANASIITLTGTSGTLISNGGSAAFAAGTSEVKVTSASGSPTLVLAAITFYKLTINSAATVINAGANITFNNTAGGKFYVQSGVFNNEGRTMTPGTAATMQMDAGGTFCLGGTTLATNATCDNSATQTSATTFPAFVSYAFNAASTVIYLTNADQTVSSTPTYGNLTFKPKLTAGHTYTMGGAMNIAGNLDINPGTAANLLTVAAAGKILVTGNTTIEGTSSATSKLQLRPASTDYDLNTSSLTISSLGTLDATSAASTITVDGNYTNNGTFTAGVSTVVFSSNVSGKTLSGTLSGSSSFYNLSFASTGAGDWTPAAAVAVTNDLTMAAGSLLGTQDITVNGNVAGTLGIINLTGGTFKQRPAGVDKNFGTTSGSAAWTFNNLTFSISGSPCASFHTITTQTGGSGSITVTGVLAVGESGDCYATALNAGNRTWTLSGTSGDPFQLLASPAATLTGSTSTFQYTGNNGGGNTTVQSATYNNLTLNAAETFVLEAATATSGNLTISAGTLDVTASNYALNVGGSFSNSGTFTAESGTVTFSSTAIGKTVSGANGTSSFYNVIFNGSGGAWTLQSALGVTNNFDITNGTLDTHATGNYAVTVGGNVTGNSGTWTLTMRASTFTVSGNWDTSAHDGVSSGSSTLIMNGSGTKTLKTASTTTSVFYNLQVGTAGGKTTQLTSSVGFKNVFTMSGGTIDLNSNALYDFCNGSSNPDPLSVTGTFGTGNGAFVMSSALGSCNQNLPAGTYNSDVGIQMGSDTITQTGTVTVTGQFGLGCCTPSSGLPGVVYDTNNQTLTIGAMSLGNGAPYLYGRASTINVTSKVYGGQWSNCSPSGGGCSYGAGTFNAGTSTVNFTATSTTAGDFYTNGQAFYNLTFNGSGSTWTPTDTTTVNGDLTVSAGTLSGTNNFTVAGNVTGAGTITLTGGLFLMSTSGTVSRSFGTTSGSSNWTFYDLQFTNSTGYTTVNTQSGGSGTITISDVLTVGHSGAGFANVAGLNAGNRSWVLSGNTGAPLYIKWADFTAQTSTFTYSGNYGSGNTSLVSGSAPAMTYNNLTFNNGSETYVLVAATTVSGTLTISAGTLDVTGSNFALNLAGDFSNSGTFTAQNGTVTLNGSSQQTLNGTFTSTSAFYNLTITNNSGASATDNERTGFTASVVFKTALTSTGTFTITTANVRVEYGDTLTYTFNNITWNGQAKATRIFFRNSVTTAGHHWLLKVTGTQTGAGAGAVSDVNVSHSDASVAGGSAIVANDTTDYDAGSNINWTFGATITVSGNIYIQGSESTQNTTPVSVSISVDNGEPSTVSGQTTSYSIPNAYDGAGHVLAIYIDGDASLNANTFTVSNGSDISGLNLYINRTAVYNHNSGNTTNANICAQTTYPASGDNMFTCSSGAPTFTGDGLLVFGGYAPGSNTTSPVVELNTGGTYTGASETLTVTGSGTGTSRPFYINGGTFTPTSDTVTFTGTSATAIESTTYNKLQLYPASGTQTYTLNSGTLTTNSTLEVGNGSTLTVAANTNNPTVSVGSTVTINSGVTWTNGSGALSIGGSYANSGTFTAGTGTVTFTATSSGQSLSGNLTGSSAFNKLAFNGAAGGWTIQDPTTVTADATDTLNIANGTVTLGNGNGDNLEVRGAMLVAATAGQSASFQTIALPIGSSITIDINQNSAGSPPDCTNCSLTVGASSGSGQGSFKITKNTLLRLNADSAAQVDLPVTVNSTGYFEAQGSQDYTGTSTSGTNETTIADTTKSWSTNENNNKLLRMTSGLAKGEIYSITATSSTTLTRTSTESASAGLTVTGSGSTRLVCSNSTSLITADHQSAGRFVHDQTGSTGYLQIIDSKNNDTNCAGSDDSFTVVAYPDSLSILANSDNFTLSDGVQAGDGYEVLDPASVTAEAGTACSASVNETGKGEAYLNAAAGSQTLIRYADICNLGRNSSTKYGLTFTSVNGSNSNEGVTVSNSRIRNNYDGLSTSSLTNAVLTNNLISGSTADGIDLTGANTGTSLSGNLLLDQGGVGISGPSLTALTVSQNTIYRPASWGIAVGGSGITVSGNTVMGSPSGGIDSVAGVNGTYTGNTLEGNATGLGLLAATGNTFGLNTVVGGTNGIATAASSNGNTFFGNSISNVSTTGLSIVSAPYSIIGNNIVSYSGSSGLSLSLTSGNAIVYNNTFTSNPTGMSVAAGNSTFFKNTADGGTWGFFTSSATTGLQLIQENYGSSSTNSSGDIGLNTTNSKLFLYDVSLHSSTTVTGQSGSGYVISRKADDTPGLVRIWGVYSIPGNNSETPQTESTEVYNYANSLWDRSAIAHNYTGSGSADSNLDYDLSSADLSGGPYTYKAVAATSGAACGSTTFTVYRNNVNVGTATCGAQFTDSNAGVGVKFKIDGGSPTTYSAGDQYSFVVWNAANDAGVAKAVQIMTSGSGYTVPSGTTVQIQGRDAGALSTITRGSTNATGWHMDVAGTINAQYYTLTYLGGTGGAAGLNLQSGATITNLAYGTFDNFQDTGGASDTYLTIHGSLIGTGTPAKTFNGTVFNQNAAVPDFSITEAGGAPSTGNYWLFGSATCNGWASCEASDSDTGDGASAPDQDGFIRFVASVAPQVDTRVDSGSVRVGGGTVRVK